MAGRIASLQRRIAKLGRLDIAVALVAFGCMVAIEALHGHECSGDGCLLCLVTALAHVFLFASIGIAFARPIVRILAEFRTSHATFRHDDETCVLIPVSSCAGRAKPSPVTLGVSLII